VTTYGDIRTGLAANLASLSLRTYGYVPDQPSPPCAIIQPVRTEFDTTFGRAADTITFDVMVLVQRTDERSGQDLLDSYCDKNGTYSVKRALESDVTLGGRVQTMQVTEITSYGAIDSNDTTYLQATFAVNVIV
jgi:hypothetical protein